MKSQLIKQYSNVNFRVYGKYKKMIKSLLCAVAFLGLFITSFSLQATQGLDTSTGKFHFRSHWNISSTDLRVKVKHRGMTITRKYKKDEPARWSWNPRWSNLLIENEAQPPQYDKSFRDSYTGITRGTDTFHIKKNDLSSDSVDKKYTYLWGKKFKRTSSGCNSRNICSSSTSTYLHTVPGKPFIVQSNEGYRWEDLNGEWINYDTEGRIKSYGRDAETIGQFELDDKQRIKVVKDGVGNFVFEIIYVDANKSLPHQITDYSGRKVTYEYNVDYELMGVVDVNGYRWSYDYDEGQITSVTDPNNNKTTYEYEDNTFIKVGADGNKQRYELTVENNTTLQAYTDPAGVVKETLYSHLGGKEKNVPNLAGQSVLQSYTKYINGELVEEFYESEKYKLKYDALGQYTLKFIGSQGELLEKQLSDGTKEKWEYQPNRLLTTKYTDANSVVTSYEYDAKSRLVVEKDGVGSTNERTTRYSYPSDSQRIITYEGDGNTNDAVWEETLDNYGNVTALKDPEGYTTKYTYNVLGQVLTDTSAKGEAFKYTYTYDNAGNLLTEQDPLARKTTYEYDNAGNLIKISEANNAVTNFSYNKLNQRTSTTNDSQHTFVAEYNRAQRTYQTKGPLNNTSTVTLDAFGQVNTVTDANGNKTAYQYQKGQLKQTTYPTFSQSYSYNNSQQVEAVVNSFSGQSTRSEFGYDPLGQLLKETDPEQKATVYSYDALGRVTTIMDANSGVTKLSYDNRDNLLTVTDPESRVTRFAYDKNDQVVAEIRTPESGQESSRTYDYDVNGNLIEEITPNGQKLVYGYDVADQLKTISFYANTAVTTVKTSISFTYNLLGQLASYDDGETSGAYGYNNLGQLISSTINYGSFSKSTAYTYDANGRIQSYTNPETIIYEYGYDPAGQPQTIKIPGQGLIAFNSYQWNQPTQITLPGGSKINRSYDGLQRLKENTLVDPAENAVMAVLYGYDKSGNILTQNTDKGDYSYGYDDLYRLTNADYPTATDETFAYDGVGNRTQHNAQTEWQYNNANQLKKQGGIDYKYDTNGHLTEKTQNGQTTYYYYDEAERLIRVENNAHSAIAEYGYNPFGHRLWKLVGGIKTYFFYNHQGMVAEYDASGTIKKEYHYLPDATWMTSPLFQRDSGTVYYYQNDHLGTPQRLVSKSGAVVWDATYEAFGKADVLTETVSNNLRFPGQYYDSETKLHHNYFRDYDPELGRYIQSDPIGLRGGLNAYGYVGGNPLFWIDPYGLQAIPWYGPGGTLDEYAYNIWRKRTPAGVLLSAIAAAMATDKAADKPSKADCNKAIKLLEQADRLAQKRGKKLPKKRLDDLKRKINDGTITSNDLPGGSQNEVPPRFRGMTLDEIRKICGKSRNRGN